MARTKKTESVVATPKGDAPAVIDYINRTAALAKHCKAAIESLEETVENRNPISPATRIKVGKAKALCDKYIILAERVSD